MRAFKNICFIGILAVLLVSGSVLTKNLMMKNDSYVQERNKSRYNILKEKENTVDIIVVGDSLSYCSVTPLQLWKDYGMTGYVCGQSGQRIDETYYMLESVYETQTPKLVILETDTLFRSRTMLKAVGEGLESMSNKYLSILEGHDIWKSLIFKKQYSTENYKGFTFRCNVVPYTNGDYMHETDQVETIPENSRIYMDEIIKLCEKHGSKILLLSTPSPLNYNYAKHNGLLAYAKEKGLDYLDLNLRVNEIGINWATDSLDNGDHLNCSGSDRLTSYLGEYLNANYTLDDHRNDSTYSEWEAESAGYEERRAAEVAKIRGIT